MYPYVAKAISYDEIKEDQITIFCLLYAENITAVAKRLQEYCDPEGIEIQCVGDECQLFEVDEDTYNSAILGCGDLITGRKILEEGKIQ